MKLFAISDLHLSEHTPKSMEIFGAHWSGHWEKIKADWEARVAGEDIVLVCGDLSWAMKLQEALPDLNAICRLPGRKILLKGNHDYWWSSASKVQAALFNGTQILQNGHFAMDDYLIVGTRGWTVPLGTAAPDDEAIYRRESIRLALSIQGAANLHEGRKIVGMMHYPPFNERRQPSEFTRQFEEAGVNKVVYGHLHGESLAKVFEGVLNGVEYIMVSCDYTDFKLRQIY